MTGAITTDISSAFREIESSALARWQELRDSGKPVIYVGTATCGRAAGALEILHVIEEELKQKQGEASLVEVGCMGHCYAEPLVIIAKAGYPPVAYGYVTEGIARHLVQDFVIGEDPCLEYALGAMEKNELIPSIYDLPRYSCEKQVLLENCGIIDPANIEHCIARGGYQSLVKALQTLPQKIIEEIKKAWLRGRGGAGFPAWHKWQTCRDAPGPARYIICNGDEGDPGAFMDRSILESDPHSVIEGMIIAGHAAGALKGYMYVRAEYPLAVRRVETALQQAQEIGILGENILGSAFSFDIELFQGSGAFVCGEATALVASIEGKRFKAVQIGGPSGGCLPQSTLGLPVDFDSLTEAGAMMGSGGMVVLDEDDCMVEVARYFLEFTQKESCGKCTMCRLGTKQMLEILQDITRGKGDMRDLVTLRDLAEQVKAGSLCGLGRTAPNPVLTTLRYFYDEYEAHIKEKRCPAKMCPYLTAFYILPHKCMRSCDACLGTCTVEAISNNKKGIKVIDQKKCVKCGTCVEACPPQYNAIIKLSPLGEVPVEGR